MDSKSGAFQRKGVSLRSTLPSYSISCMKPCLDLQPSTADLLTCIESCQLSECRRVHIPQVGGQGRPC